MVDLPQLDEDIPYDIFSPLGQHFESDSLLEQALEKTKLLFGHLGLDQPVKPTITFIAYAQQRTGGVWIMAVNKEDCSGSHVFDIFTSSTSSQKKWQLWFSFGAINHSCIDYEIDCIFRRVVIMWCLHMLC